MNKRNEEIIESIKQNIAKSITPTDENKGIVSFDKNTFIDNAVEEHDITVGELERAKRYEGNYNLAAVRAFGDECFRRVKEDSNISEFTAEFPKLENDSITAHLTPTKTFRVPGTNDQTVEKFGHVRLVSTHGEERTSSGQMKKELEDLGDMFKQHLNKE